MSPIQAKAPGIGPATAKILARILVIAAVAFCIATGIHQASKRFERSLRPAGFNRGILDGALMPMTLPNLLAGQNVTIYDENNVGRSYKLGYTLGVNSCGALFFGIFFWRVTRWRKRDRAREQAVPSPAVET